MILDCNFGPIKDAAELVETLGKQAGVLEHGLFLNLSTDVIAAGPGGIRHLRRSDQ